MSKTRTFREFLQSLKPGEIGFVIASFGATSALILTSNSIFQASKQREVAAHKEWRKVTAHVEHLVSEGTPVEGLSTIKFYQSRLREEARDLLGIEDATTDEICDEWVRRRNKGDREALEIEHVRLRLKRFWHSIESAAEYGVQHHQTINSSRSSKRYVPSEINQQGEHIGTCGGHVLKDLLGGGMGYSEANDRLVLKTLMFLERLDLACCRNHPKCIWERKSSPQWSIFITFPKQCPVLSICLPASPVESSGTLSQS
eukprot:m.313687 g.313687  ORF g.313687 m.313687 type:complete len:258 (-) comp20256_c1_seq26:245-1018(-)